MGTKRTVTTYATMLAIPATRPKRRSASVSESTSAPKPIAVVNVVTKQASHIASSVAVAAFT